MKICLSVLCVLLFLPAVAAPEKGSSAMATGLDLLEQCGNDLSYEHTSKYCLGYMAGFMMAESIHTDQAQNDKQHSLVCLPDGTTTGQVVLIVQKFIRENPKMVDMSSSFIVWAALRDAYMCQNRRWRGVDPIGTIKEQ